MRILPAARALAGMFNAHITLLQIVPALHVAEGFHPLASVTGSTEITAAERNDAESYLRSVADKVIRGSHTPVLTWSGPAS